MSKEGGELLEAAEGGEEEYMISRKDMAALKKMMDEQLEVCGWKKFVRKLARLVLVNNGINVTNNCAAAKIMPFAYDLVPDALLKDLEDRVADILYGD